MRWKRAIVLSVVMIVVMSIAGFGEAAAKKTNTSKKRPAPSKAAVSQKTKAQAQNKAPVPVTSDDIIADEMLKLAEALRRNSQLERWIPEAEENKQKRAAQYDAEIEKVNEEIEKLTENIAQLEQKILDLEDKRDEVLDSDSEDIEIELAIDAVQDEIDNIADNLFISFDVMPEYVYAFNPKATSQVTGWTMTQDEVTEVEKLSLTVLHNRKTNRLTRITVASDLTDSGDIFFKVDSLPEGVQIVIPKNGSRTWTVKADGRVGNKKFDSKGYFVAEITDPEDIAYSSLDGNSKIDDDGNKTFKSGEAFIILRKSSITIYPDEPKL